MKQSFRDRTVRCATCHDLRQAFTDGRRLSVRIEPVGELIPLRQRVFVRAEAALSAFAGAPRVALGRFRKDVDAVIDQDPTPRG